MCEWEFIKDLFQFHNHGNTINIMGFKQPNSDVFHLPIAKGKNNNHRKIYHEPLLTSKNQMWM